MIAVLFRRPASGELMHPRVAVVSVQDVEQGAALVSALGGEATGRPCLRRGTVAELLARDAAALDRELAKLRRRAVRRHRRVLALVIARRALRAPVPLRAVAG